MTDYEQDKADFLQGRADRKAGLPEHLAAGSKEYMRGFELEGKKNG